ncbi:type III secretion system translocon subunit SctE [Pseudochelatococcus sp. G4_1912]|uniref:type III secretion system translocon subunit SctE n=1 Tax=Pseudochelatococcus sp. G4_1912 TaxID=3114288 RepID=UPI0039C7234D
MSVTNAVSTTIGSGLGTEQTKSTGTTTKTSTAAYGVSGQNGAVPSATEKEQDSLTLNAQQIQALFAAIREILPEGQEDTDLMLMQIAEALKETQSKVQSMGIEASTGQRKSDLKELQKKQDEAEAARKKAEKKSGIAKLFSKIAGWFSAIATIIAGAVMMATGNPLGAIVIAVGVTMAVNEAVKQGTGKSIAANIWNNQYFDMGFSIGLAVIAAAASAGPGIVSLFSSGTSAAGTAAAAGSAAGSATSSAVSSASSAATTAASTVSQTAGKTTATWLEIGMGAAQAVVTATATATSADATLSQSSLQKKNAGIKDFEAIMEAMNEFIQRALKQLIGVEQSIENLKDQAYEAIKTKQAVVMNIKIKA